MHLPLIQAFLYCIYTPLPVGRNGVLAAPFPEGRVQVAFSSPQAGISAVFSDGPEETSEPPHPAEGSPAPSV